MSNVLGQDPYSLKQAAEFIKSGKLVAFPTETVYGLGADLFQPKAIAEIFRVKGRPSDNPLIAHVADFSQIEQIAYIPSIFHRLFEAFFPGPLTVVLRKRAEVPSIVSGGGQTVAIRMPNHPVALAFIRACGTPLVAPSANISGRPSSTQVAHILEDFKGSIAAIIDGGECEIGIESTVISLISDKVVLLRPGAITAAEIEEVLQEKIESGGDTNTPLSPGMKYRHYAPDAEALMFETESALNAHIAKYPERKRIVATPTTQTLYALLREADSQKCEEICLLCTEEIRRDTALLNRLQKACCKTDKVSF